jgi:hypothetical protein
MFVMTGGSYRWPRGLLAHCPHLLGRLCAHAPGDQVPQGNAAATEGQFERGPGQD